MKSVSRARREGRSEGEAKAGTGLKGGMGLKGAAGSRSGRGSRAATRSKSGTGVLARWIMVFGLVFAGAGRAAELRLLSADEKGLWLEWRGPEPGEDRGGPGPRPEAEERTGEMLLAFPPGSHPGYRVEGPAGGEGRFSAAGLFRDVDLRVFSFKPGKGPAARIRIDFEAEASAGLGLGLGKAGPVSASGSAVLSEKALQSGNAFGSGKAFRSAPARIFAPARTDAAERALAGLLGNYEQSRSFRYRLPEAGRAEGIRAGGPGSEAAGGTGGTMALGKAGGAFAPGRSGSGTAPIRLPALRLVLKTRTDGIGFLDFEALRRAGVPVSRLDPRTLRLWKLQGYPASPLEQPLFVAGEADGRFDAGDHLEFLSSRPKGRDRFHSLYTAEASWVITWGEGRGLRAPLVPAGKAPPGTAEATPFRRLLHAEEDLEILRTGSAAAGEVQDLGDRVQAADPGDFWFWKRQGVGADQSEVVFDLPEAPAPASLDGTADSAVVRIQLRGITNHLKASPDHHVRFLLNGRDICLVNGRANDAFFEGQDLHTWTSAGLPAAFLRQGKNTLTLLKVKDLRTTDGAVVEHQDAFLNWVEVEYRAGYAVGETGALTFFQEPRRQERRSFALTGRVAAEASLWDAEGRKLTGFTVTGGGGAPGRLLFSDSLAGRTEYRFALPEAREIPRIRLDTLEDLLTPAGSADYLVLTRKSLRGPALDSLVRHREAQGLKVKVVDMDHVYQIFGDGSCDPEALRRFTAFAFSHYPRPAPLYLLLLGETTLWFDKKEGRDQPNLVPTSIVHIPGWGIAAQDDYFAQVAGDDAVADLFVGRIPVATGRELSAVVEKMLRLEKERPEGPWKNRTFLLSGYEDLFTRQNARLQGLAFAHNRQVTRMDLFPASPHYVPPAEKSRLLGRLDSADQFVLFAGHGGGAVWSDQGALTLEDLAQDRLKGAYPIPMVFSVTCLTGYFEDVNPGSSLGESLLRRPGNGAAAFYGASGYISAAAGEMLSGELLRAAYGTPRQTAGALIHRAETVTALKSGGRFAPILAEFHLLGDPALPLSSPLPAAKPLELSPAALNGKSRLTVRGHFPDTPALLTGEGEASFIVEDSLAGEDRFLLQEGRFETERDLAPGTGPKLLLFRRGKVIAHAFPKPARFPGGGTAAGAGKGEALPAGRVAAAEFSGLDWILEEAGLEPPEARIGDSVRFRFRLRTAYREVRFQAGIVLFGLGPDSAGTGFSPSRSLPLQSAEGLEYRSPAFILGPSPAVLSPHLHFEFRVGLLIREENGTERALPNLRSRLFSLPLKEPPGPALAPLSIRPAYSHRAGVFVSVRNRGRGRDSLSRLVLRYETAARPASGPEETGGPAGGADTAALPPLAPGGSDSVFFALPDAALAGPLRAEILPGPAGDAFPEDNLQDTSLSCMTRILASSADTLFSPGGNSWVTGPAAAAGAAPRVYLEGLSLPAGGGPPLPSHLREVGGSEEALRLRLVPSPSAALPGPILLAQRTAPARFSDWPETADWHFRSSSAAAWQKRRPPAESESPPLQNSSVLRSIAVSRSGDYALFLNRDQSPPLIEASCRGRRLLPDDYLPRGEMLDIVIRDAEGLDTEVSPPGLFSPGRGLDSSGLQAEAAPAAPRIFRFRLLPRQGVERDSLEAFATDISGNASRIGFSYRLGEGLSIRHLGGYPNPFADTTVFAFTLTDFCDKVHLQIFSRAGRRVRSFSERQVVGYREIPWDGRDEEGRRVANGLYYLKASAEARGKEVHRIFKVFKKSRK